jgi:RluA family pseudouridine synthase
MNTYLMIDQKSNNTEILFEDPDVIVLNKPEGLASISENDPKIESLHSILEKKLAIKIFPVHRLDKEVSGVIIFAKNGPAHKILNDQFEKRLVKKFYVTLVHGQVTNDSGIINKSIREFGSGRMGVDERKGKPSETKYRILERYNNYTTLELNPSSGRRHQLRVHLYFIGFPIVGDLRYGDKTTQQKYPRLMLHASKIEFQLPSGKNISVFADLPVSFSSALNEIIYK